MQITIIGLDISKSVFQVHGVNEPGERLLRRQLRRREVLRFFANLEPCVVGIEACHSSHYGHSMRPLPCPLSVKADMRA